MKKRIKWVVAFFAMLMVVFGIQKIESIITGGKAVEEEAEVIIDSGHGGIDPGKIGVHGESEKEINLKIAKELQKDLKARGVKVIMTRTGDKGLYDEASENKKVQDLKNRVDLINRVQPKLVVSIHQNSYGSPDVSGLQIFYFKHSSKGKQMAETLQKSIEQTEQINSRPIKGDDTYYMLKRTEVPTVIIECGFLSNPQEASMLTEQDYQKKLAQIIADGVDKCIK